MHHTHRKLTKTECPILSLEQQVEALRAKNRVLETVVSSIKNTLNMHYDKKYDLVWYAKNRCRYPNHHKSKELDHSASHRKGIEDLRGLNGDYHHGLNCGTMATCRLLKNILDGTIEHLEKVDNHILINHQDIMESHRLKVQEADASFPDLSLE